MSTGLGRSLARFGVVFALTGALYTIYQLTNRHHLWPPRTLPLTALDHAIPFWPWTVVPYFALIGGMYLPALVAERTLFRRALAALTIGTLINDALFGFWPTEIVRPPAPQGEGFWLDWYRWLTAIDSPANCFPSGHITAPAVGCWALAREHRRWRWPIRLAFVPFALTILTTKQHYAVDLIGGLATAALGVALTRGMQPPRARKADATPAAVPAAA